MPGHPLWESTAFFVKSESGLCDAACCLLELVSTARCNKPAWSEILFAWASPPPEREARWRLWKEPEGKGHVCHCRATEAWLIRRHEGKIRAGERAPLCGRSPGRKHACPEPLGPRRQQLLGHLSVVETRACHQVHTLNLRNNSQIELTIRCHLPPGCGRLEEAWG